jgi:hypothetical protein
MKRTTLVAAAILTTVSSAALAQATSPNSSAPPASATAKPQAGGPGLRQQLTNSLQQSGFTDIKIVPDSFLVQANDKSGNPVTMFIGPNSATEFTSIGSNDQTSGSNAGGKSDMQSGGMFTNIPVKDELSSKVVGLDVYNNANQNIGTIKDVAYNGTSVNGYILGVGGFLGMGDHYVAVRPTAIKLSYDAKDKKWHANMDANADQLKAAPEYKYPSNT